MQISADLKSALIIVLFCLQLVLHYSMRSTDERPLTDSFHNRFNQLGFFDRFDQILNNAFLHKIHRKLDVRITSQHDNGNMWILTPEV